MVYTAALLGYRAMAVTDVNSVAGVVRAYEAARKIRGFRLIVGSRLEFADGTPDLLVWPTQRAAYARLCQILTLGRRRAKKGECHLTLTDFLQYSDGLLAAVIPRFDSEHPTALATLREFLGDRLSLAVSLPLDGDDQTRLQQAVDLSRRSGIALLATNHVHFHEPSRHPLHDVLACVRHGCTIQQAGRKLSPNAERYLKSPRQMHNLFADFPAAIRRAIEVADQCRFDLGQLRYEYPAEAKPADISATQYLRHLTYQGAARRYPDGISEKVRALLEKELSFICGSQYESYFLTVQDLVHYARSQGILCQGRGSAANSAVCYCLGVTAVDPEEFQLVFERFASTARDEPPDIDIDFEHERREEVIQYVYRKYGRDRAAMTASLITYRGRSAIRDVAKALGLSQDMIDQLAGTVDWWHRGALDKSAFAGTGINPDDPVVRRLAILARQLLGFPRHLSQHVGGMVISRSPLSHIVPVENAAMPDRTVIEWDKDDLDVLKMFKVDLLGLGMLTCISRGLAMINSYSPGKPVELHTIPREDPAVYDMICKADTIGVFQIESRAQMSMLPRLRPREFYDLVIEVAIVRPGPIQGDMVHPYLQRRKKKRQDPDYQIEYPKEELRDVLEKTLGVPLFQEQAMRLAIVAAAFTGAEADQLRRAMAAWKRSAGIERFHDKFVNGMIRRGYQLEFAERCFKQISGFGEYGFPESHAASFAWLVYFSAWLKCHHPAAFAASLLNSQPMGFYAPAQIVRDAREHGVEVRPVDVNSSHWDCTLEHDLAPSSSPALRLGLRLIKGIGQPSGDQIAAMRRQCGPFISVEQFQRASTLPSAVIRRLAEADAFASLDLNRRSAAWQALALSDESLPLIENYLHLQPPPHLPPMPAPQEVRTDYATIGLSLRPHPVSFIRDILDKDNVIPAAALRDEKQYPHGRRVKVAGLVLVRQRPGTASGVVFVTLEDETGIANLVLWSTVYERFRTATRYATLLQVEGQVQRESDVIHILAARLVDRTPLLRGMAQVSRDFH
jgi:error-prone DNA polymerase